MNNSLFVPIDLEVLLVNTALKDRDQFRWWNYTYSNLSDDSFTSPESTDNVSNVNVGTYLHWSLPRALRLGKEGSSTDFPMVPNRWLIVRIHRTATGNNVQKAWVIESDCPSQIPNSSSHFLVDEAVITAWKNASETNRKTYSIDNNKISTGNSSTFDTKTYTANIGVAFPLANWTEQFPSPMYLTAIAPGNLEFSAYVPHNLGVFSFYDDMTDDANNSIPDQCTISYMVTGWYSDTTQDIINPNANGNSSGTTIDEVLSALNWTLNGAGDTSTLTTSLYTGMSFGLNWDKTAITAPAPDPLENSREQKNMTVAIANSSVDAFTTLIGNQLELLPNYSDPNKVIILLRAFQYDLLQLLNQVNGEAILDEKIKQQWFNSKSGGIRWIITMASAQEDGLLSNAGISEADEAWLVELNQNQQALNEAFQTLYSLQWDLCAVWWKYGFLSGLNQQMAPVNNTGLEPSDLATLLDPSNEKGVLAPVLTQLLLIDSLLVKLPQPIPSSGATEQEAFTNGINAFATSKGIANGFVLKALAQPRFWKPNNPNVIISKVQPSAMTDPDSSLMVRWSTQAISNINISNIPINATTISGVIPGLPVNSSLPDDMNVLYQEFFLLDVANAQQIATTLGIAYNIVSEAMNTQAPTNYNGILPSNSLVIWSQTWNPMYIEWTINYVNIPYEWIDENGHKTCNWVFNGYDYELAPTVLGADTIPKTISGRSLLSPHLQFTFGARLKDFVDQYGANNQNLTDLYNQIQTTDNWTFLSQDLVNFDELFIQRDASAFRKPTVETFMLNNTPVLYSNVMGFTGDGSQMPYETPLYAQGLVNSIPAVKIGGQSDYDFHPIRSGQFYINSLLLYDKFGRVLDLVDPNGTGGLNDADNFPLVVDGAMTVVNNQFSSVSYPFQLPPRIMQGLRLDMLLVDQKTETNVLGLANGVNPVCGWVISNHLDQAISVFAPDGTSMGEIRLTTNASAVRTAKWIGPPHNDSVTLDFINTIAPNLKNFISGLVGNNNGDGRSEVEFQAFIDAIDSTLWTTDPLSDRTDQNLSVMIGRPLALIRLQLRFTLDGNPIAPCDWPMYVPPSTPEPNIPPFTSSVFNIRLGDQATRQDGVIGYFEKDNYTIFNSVVLPNTGQAFVNAIGPFNEPNMNNGDNYIKLPVDSPTSELVTLLVDPRGSIHATTGILPVKELVIPSQFIDGPLSNMEISFNIGPMITKVQAASVANGTPPFPNAITHPSMAEQNGAWSWWEKNTSNQGQPPITTTTWQGYELNKAMTQANFNDLPAELKEGYLQFISNLNKDN